MNSQRIIDGLSGCDKEKKCNAILAGPKTDPKFLRRICETIIDHIDEVEDEELEKERQDRLSAYDYDDDIEDEEEELKDDDCEVYSDIDNLFDEDDEVADPMPREETPATGEVTYPCIVYAETEPYEFFGGPCLENANVRICNTPEEVQRIFNQERFLKCKVFTREMVQRNWNLKGNDIFEQFRREIIVVSMALGWWD